MSREVSKAAKEIIDAGIAAMTNGSTSEKSLSDIDRAIEEAVGKLSVKHVGGSERPVVNALIEIAQLYVRDRAQASPLNRSLR